MRVKLIGWKRGLQKISLNRLLRDYSKDFSLATAKTTVDDLLDDKLIEFEIEDRFAYEFKEKAESLGVVVEIPSGTSGDVAS